MVERDVWPTPPPALLAAVRILGDSFGEWAQVSTRLPATNMPDRFIKVTRIGGSQTNPASDNMRVLVECYAKHFHHCEPMANQARSALRNAAGTTVHPIIRVGPDLVTLNIFVRGVNNETAPVDRPHPDIVDRDRFEFQCELAVKSN